MEHFLLTEFSYDDMDFDFSIYEDNVDPASKTIQNPQDSCVHFSETHLGFVCERTEKQMTSKSWHSNCSIINKSSLASSSSKLISFGFSDVSSPAIDDKEVEQHGSSLRCEQGTKRKERSCGRSPVLAQEHVLAERKRREKLNERFIALSALLPGLKKADKATVLGDATKHLKELQERIRKLEEEKVAVKDTESVIFVKKSRIFIDEETYFSSSYSDEDFNQALPEVEAKLSEKDVLIRIHCERRKGSTVSILNEIEKLHLSVMNSIVLPFGDFSLDITVLAKMEKDFSMTVKDLVKNLRLAMLQSP